MLCPKCGGHIGEGKVPPDFCRLCGAALTYLEDGVPLVSPGGVSSSHLTGEQVYQKRGVRKRRPWNLWGATKEERTIFQDFFGGLIAALAIWNLIGIIVGLFISGMFNNLLFENIFIVLSVIIFVSTIVAAGRMGKYMDHRENRAYAQRFKLEPREFLAILFVITLVTSLLLAFDLEQYNREIGHKRQYEFMLFSVPMLGGWWYTAIRGTYLAVPVARRFLRHYVLPVILVMIGFSAGFVVCGSGFCGFVLFVIAFYGAEHEALNRLSKEPAPWNLRGG